MTVQGEQVSVTSVPVALASGGVNGCRVNLYNAGAVIYLGGLDGFGTMSSSAGRRLGSAESIEISLDHDEVLYGAAAAAGTSTVHVLRTGVNT